MKKKITMGLAFVILAGSTLFGAYVYSNAHAGKSEQCFTTEVAGLAYATESITDCEEPSAEKTRTKEKESGQPKNKEEQTTGSATEKTDKRKETKTESPKQTTSTTSIENNSTAARQTEENKPATSTQTMEAAKDPEQTTEVNPEENKPTEAANTTEATKKPEQPSEAVTEATTEVKRVWHPEVTEKVWVVDQEAWSETITYTDYIDCYVCTNCGAVFSTYDEGYAHLDASLARHTNGEIALNEVCNSFKTWQKPVEKTETFDYPEKGHWETRVISEGYWE